MKKIFLSVFISGIILLSLTGCGTKSIDETATTRSGVRALQEEYGDILDFNAIYAGASCLTGKQTSTQKTEEYGTVTIEFSYCKNNNSYYIHIYN